MNKSVWNRAGLLLALVVIAALGLGASAAQAGGSGGGVVNINTASVDQLQLLKGIGVKKAQAIVQYRNHKPFAKVEDLAEVKGIGAKLLMRLRPQLTVQGPTTLGKGGGQRGN